MSLPNTASGPDISQLRDGALPEAPFPGGRGLDFRICFGADVHPALWAHALADTSIEVCGVLVGRWGRDADGPFVAVSGSIVGNAAESKFAEVTFTHETWSKINEEMDQKYPELTIVGWYHTHPDFGVFLSDRDIFIQQHFFAEAGHIAHVIDPIRRTEGVFVWRQGKPALTPHFWVGSELKTSTAAGAESVPVAPVATVGASAVPVAPQRSFLPPLERLLAYLCLLLLGYLLASYRTAWTESRLIEGTVAHYGIWQGLRPGLGENLDKVSRRLQLVSAGVDALAADHLKRLSKDEKPDDLKKDWKSIRDALSESTAILAEIKTVYDLSPAEAIAVREQITRKLQELGQLPPDRSPEKEKTPVEIKKETKTDDKAAKKP